MGDLDKRLKAFHSQKNAQRSNKDFLPDSPKAYYDLPDAPKCKVCQSGDYVVSLVNRLLVSGATIKDIYETVQPIAKSIGTVISVNSIKTHQTKHLPYAKSALRKIAEANAALAEKDMIAGETSIITPMGFAEAMLHKGFENLSETRVKPSDALQAAKLVSQIQSETNNVNETVVELRRQQSLIISAIQEHTTQDQQEAILSYIRDQSPEFAQRERQSDYRNIPNPNHFDPQVIEAAPIESDAEYVDMDAIAGVRDEDWQS